MSLPPIITGMLSVSGFILGLVVVIATPWVVAPSLPERYRANIARFYYWFSQTAIQRALIVKYRHTDVDLCASEYHSQRGVERISLDGEIREFEDIGDRIRYLSDKPLGIVLERANCVFDVLDAELGAIRAEILEVGAEEQEFSIAPDGGNGASPGSIVGIADFVQIRAQAIGQDLSKAMHLLGGSGEPNQGEVTYRHAKASQAAFKNANRIDMFVWAGIFVGTLIVIYLAFDFASGMNSSGGGSVDIPIGMVAGWWL